MSNTPSSSANLHAEMRRPLPTAILSGAIAILALSPLFPGVAEQLGVTLAATLPPAIVFIVVTIVTSWVFARYGAESTAFRRTNIVETITTMSGSAWILVLGNQPTSLFWFLYLGVCLSAGTSGANRRLNIWLVAAAPTIVVAAFLLRRNVGGAIVAAAIGGIGVYLYATLSSAAVRMAESIRERDRLQKHIAELQVQSERARIARDLHDGIGAELAALIWRARRIQSELENTGAADGERVRDLEVRVSAGVEELRNIVWALRTPPKSLEDWAAHTEDRCRDLCGDRHELIWRATLAPFPIELQEAVTRMIWEAVRNAVRHAVAKTIRVDLTIAEALLLVVSDDGVGLPATATTSRGGLRNLRERAEELGGTFSTRALDPGTAVEIRLPLDAAVLDSARGSV